ncbi:carboxymuconolactone decarboxylase family protein [Mycobacterium sp. AZCC_0083]|uniref:carboxymuconolactone decarboxylase family protein n=1 Tax=Mycobacterium sp. AZCC_0083 TaxID=2735882 RepID=UPI0016124F28|nr:carboxymuconolactone decarboxylase family protein [Mycobacterium sp. AZCC_0083]MBB5166305.1 AhpD family alkylhydroperoxidase [Mycobacterium sp. AZCC_0083]
MTLVPLLESKEFSEADHHALALGEKAYGMVLNTWAAIGNSPGLFAAYLPFLRQLNGPGELDVRIKDLAAVRVAVLNHCRYTTSHRCKSAQANGVTADELTALARGDFARFTARERIALELAGEMTATIPVTTYDQSATGVSAPILEVARTSFGPGELVELTMGISLWNALSRFHRVMAFELDMPVPPAGVDELL